MRRILLAMLIALACSVGAHAAEMVTLEKGYYAVMRTSQGDFVIVLYERQAPKTVKNFVDLVQGQKKWKDPKTGAWREYERFYDGTRFHRILRGVMIQGGDPLGGEPSKQKKVDLGFTVPMEKSPDLKHDKKGRVSMARIPGDPDSATTQFFISLKPLPMLDVEPKHYAVFGQVIEGLEALDAVESSPVVLQPRVGTRPPEQSKPRTPIILRSVELIRSHDLYDVTLASPAEAAVAPPKPAVDVKPTTATVTLGQSRPTSGGVTLRVDTATSRVVPVNPALRGLSPHEIFFGSRPKITGEYRGAEPHLKELPETKY